MQTDSSPTLRTDCLAELDGITLSQGAHNSINQGMCVMEAVAWVAGEPHSDTPQCACPVITAFMVSWNDSLPDADRTRLLKPLIPLIVETRSTPAVEQRRATMAADWLIRVHTPAWLRLAKLESQAAALEALPEITDFARCPGLMPTLEAMRHDASAARAAGAAAWDAAWDDAWDAAWDAAWAAAGDAARDAAWDAAWAAAWAAAGDAARDAAGAAAWAAAWDAAWDAAWAAAGDAARDAAWDAAGAAAGDAARDALKPTTERLQVSAVDLVRRMCEVTA